MLTTGPRSTAKTPVLPPPLPESQGGWSTLFEPAQREWSACVALGLLCVALCFYGLNIGEFYRTESLRAIIAAEFLNSGNWIVPSLYGEPLLTKPPGMYAAIAAASWPLGHVTEWTARLPSALAASAVVFLFYWYASRQVGRLGGLIVAAVTPCTVLWLEKSSAAEIDMLQVAWTAAALLFFFRAVEAEEDAASPDAATVASPSSPFKWWILSLMCVAGGVLTKWTAPAFFYAAAVPFLIWRRRFGLLFSWRHLLAAALGAGICLAWVGLVVYQVGWETLYQTVSNEALPRLSHSHHLGNTSKQVLETLQHPFKLLLVNLPWSGFALLTLVPGFYGSWDDRGRRLLQAFHCWAWPNLIVWTILPDHATRHSFPLFPGITALGAMAWIAFLSGRLPPRLSRFMVGAAVVALVAFGVGTVGGGLAGFRLLPSSTWWLLIIVVGMGLGCVFEGLRAFREQRYGWLLTSIIVTWVVLKVALVQIYVPIRNHGREPQAKGAVLAHHVPVDHILYVFKLKDEGIMFYYGRPVVRLKSWTQLPAAPGQVYCILQRAELADFQQAKGWQIVKEVPLVDEQGDPIVLLGLERTRTPTMLNASSGQAPSLEALTQGS